MCSGFKFGVWVALAWVVQGCAPPSIRAAHSIDKGTMAFELGGSIDVSGHQSKLLTLTGSDSLPLREKPTAHAMVVIGLGAGFEIGTGMDLMLKYSILDERRHDTPLSVAVMGATPTFEFLNQGDTYDLSAGVLLSRHVQMGRSAALRPVLNALYSQRDYQATTPIPESLTDSDMPVSEPEMWTSMRYKGIDIPMGVEIPLVVGDKWALAPTVSYTLSVPLDVAAGDFSCDGCAFAIDVQEMGTPMSLWVGLKLQPKWQSSTGGSDEEL